MCSLVNKGILFWNIHRINDSYIEKEEIYENFLITTEMKHIPNCLIHIYSLPGNKPTFNISYLPVITKMPLVS